MTNILRVLVTIAVDCRFVMALVALALLLLLTQEQTSGRVASIRKHSYSGKSAESLPISIARPQPAALSWLPAADAVQPAAAAEARSCGTP